MKRKVLVTGGTGYIGSHTIVDLHSKGYDVVSVDSGINSDVSVLKGIEKITGKKATHYDGDLCDIRLCNRIFLDNPDIAGVVHFAALKAVGESVDQPIRYFRNNIDSTLNLLENCVKSEVKAFVFSSSCTVYGDVEKSPVTELTPWKEAASPYGRTKQMCEHLISDVVRNEQMKAIFLRYFNPAGAHPSGHIGESPVNLAQNLVPVITETAIGKRSHMTVFGHDYPTRDGSCIRDYVHVCDLADAHTLALEYIFNQNMTTSTDVFNLGIGEGLTVLEIIKAFESVTGETLSYKLGDRRPGDVVAIFSDNTKAKEVLNWTPKYGADDIMRTAWEWEKIRSKGQ